MMKAKAGFSLLCAALCGVGLLVAGCRRSMPSAAEQADRASRHYTAAMAELQAGRIDAAIKGFENVIREEPGNGNAHFQLAALLEDSKKDYLGAIVHYRLYLTIRPQSDKAAIAADRLKGCETRYAAILVEKAGVESQFSAELEKLQKEHSQCGRKMAKVSEQLDEANRKIAALEKNLAVQKKMLENAEAIRDDPTVAQTPKQRLRAMLDEDEKNTPTHPPINVAEAGGDEPESAPPTASTNAPSVSNPFVQKEKKPKRLIPETYTVEEGDTLMRISARFYGTNRKWREIREANKAIISSDGRVKTGQVIKLP